LIKVNVRIYGMVEERRGLGRHLDRENPHKAYILEFHDASFGGDDTSGIV